MSTLHQQQQRQQPTPSHQSPRPTSLNTPPHKKEGEEAGLVGDLESAARDFLAKTANVHDLQALGRIADDVVKVSHDFIRDAFSKNPQSQDLVTRAFILCVIDFIGKLCQTQSSKQDILLSTEKLIKEISSIPTPSSVGGASPRQPSPKPTFETTPDVTAILTSLPTAGAPHPPHHQHAQSQPPQPPQGPKPKIQSPSGAKTLPIQKKLANKPLTRSASMTAPSPKESASGPAAAQATRKAPQPPPPRSVTPSAPSTKKQLPQAPSQQQQQQQHIPPNTPLPPKPPKQQQQQQTSSTGGVKSPLPANSPMPQDVGAQRMPSPVPPRRKSSPPPPGLRAAPLPPGGAHPPVPVGKSRASKSQNIAATFKSQGEEREEAGVGKLSTNHESLSNVLTAKMQKASPQTSPAASPAGGEAEDRRVSKSDTPSEGMDDVGEDGMGRDERMKKKPGIKGLFRSKSKRKGSVDHMSDTDSDGEDVGEFIQQSSGGMKIVMIRSNRGEGEDDGDETNGAGDSNAGENEPKTKRDYITDEIISTEKTYVEGLRIVSEIYEQPMRSKRIISDEDVTVIFINIGKLLEIHSKLLSELKGNKDRFGEIFLSVMPSFEAYKDYGRGYYDGNALASEYKRTNSKFKKFLSEQGKCHSSVVSLDLLESLLITPIQRIPRYNLLLADLIKNTPEDHPDLPNLKESLKKMIEMAEQVNLAIKFNENKKKMIQIQQLILLTEMDDFDKKKMGALVQDHRMFVREGDLVMKDDKGVKQGVHMFLFNDIILVTKKKMLASQYIAFLYEPLETPDVEEIPKAPESSTFKFSLSTLRGKYVFSLPDQDERDEWVRTINTQQMVWSHILKEKTNIMMKMKTEGLSPEEAFKRTYLYNQRLLNGEGGKGKGNAGITAQSF